MSANHADVEAALERMIIAARAHLVAVRDAKGETDFEVLEKDGKLHLLRQPSPWSLTAGLAERAKDAVASLL